MRYFAFSPVAMILALVQAGVVERRAVSLPAANGKFDYQLGGAYTPPAGTVTVVRDRTDPIAPNLYNICYINAFQTQAGSETNWWKTNYDGLLLRKTNGQYFEDSGWPGEILLDTRTPEKQTAIANILKGWIDGCATAGYNAIEPDNLDTFTRRNSPLSKANNLALAKLIADYAHSKNLAIAQKNTAELGSEGKTTAGFDFAIAEACHAYEECEEYFDVYGTAVLEIEYTENGREVYLDACADHGSTVSIIYRDVDLVASGQGGYRYEAC
ncbi:glycoside hydrolase family 114 protein [Coprinopsis sp. MPI-PUGE-AT-0042]|nr:glycoside hydrolase family 114 protein [Coprinopsis sp. MPI-PUGE-AT-0042]